jgi:hypothetical protein
MVGRQAMRAHSAIPSVLLRWQNAQAIVVRSACSAAMAESAAAVCLCGHGAEAHVSDTGRWRARSKAALSARVDFESSLDRIRIKNVFEKGCSGHGRF